MVVITFSLLYWKHSFWVNLVQKSKLPVLSEIWYLDLFEYEEFSGGVYFFCFILEKPSLVNEEKWSAIQKQPSRGVLRKVVLKICSKFTGGHPCRSVISIKLLWTAANCDYYLCYLRELRLRYRHLSSTWLFYFVAVWSYNTKL